MAYLDRTAPNNRAVVLTAVAVIHVAAGYAIVTGLAVDYVKDITAVFEARNIPVDPPPEPPKPQPTVKPPETDTRIVVPQTVMKIPTTSSPIIEQTQDILPPFSVPTGEIERLVPIPQPLPVPTGTPRMARPLGRPGNWATANDYPARDLREGNQGVTSFLLAIGTDGRVQSCQIIGSSGFPGLDRTTCDKITARARFEAATDGGGNRVAGSYRGSIHWVIPE